jgi:hypothetical protein
MRAGLLALIFGLGFGVASAAAGDTDWPNFRFDRKHTGVNPFETVLSKKTVPFAGLEWQAQLGDLVDYSSPAVVNGVVYIGSLD